MLADLQKQAQGKGMEFGLQGVFPETTVTVSLPEAALSPLEVRDVPHLCNTTITRGREQGGATENTCIGMKVCSQAKTC